MTHVAFHRKYRPRSFDEVVGQEAIAQALQGAVIAHRTAPVYLFSGSHGVGKTSMARILAKALNCPVATDGAPCLTCDTCISIDRGEALDVVEIDAASNRSVDDAERIRQNVHYRAQAAPYKIYILDEVHQLSRFAFDALLKTFEEAPEHARFILATTELHKVPSTIKSRAQVFHFRRSGRVAVETRLRQIAEAEGAAISGPALSILARRARGSMRDAQKMLDQVVSLSVAPGTEISAADAALLLGAFTAERVERLLGAIARSEPGTLLAEVADHLACGGQVGTFLSELTEAIRASLYYKTCGGDSPLLEEFPYDGSALRTLADAVSEEALLLGLQLLSDVEQKLRIAKEPRVLLEVALVRLARAAELRPLGEVLARLERLEASLTGDGPPPRLSARSGGGAPRRAPAPPTPTQPAAPAAPRTTAPPANAAPSARTRQRRNTTQQRSYAVPADMARSAGRGEPAPAVAPSRPDRSPRPQPATQPARASRPAVATASSAVATAPQPQAQQRPPQPQVEQRAPQPQAQQRPPQPAPAAQPAPAPGPAQAVSGETVQEAWARVRAKLPEAIGMVAEVLIGGDPRVTFDPARGVVQLLVRLGNFSWKQVNEPKNLSTITGLFRAELGEGAPELELVRDAGAGGGAANDGGPSNSVYDEELVKLCQRELDAHPMGR